MIPHREPGVGARCCTLVQLAFAILSLWGSLAITAMALDGAERAAVREHRRRRLLPALWSRSCSARIASLLTLPIPASWHSAAMT
jgi:hypothetical protein